jgi:hypothetical protein
VTQNTAAHATSTWGFHAINDISDLAYLFDRVGVESFVSKSRYTRRYVRRGKPLLPLKTGPGCAGAEEFIKFRAKELIVSGTTARFFCSRGVFAFMVKLIIEPKKGKDGQIDYVVTYHDVKTDNQFTVTTTSDLNEAVQRLKETLESEVKASAPK